MVATSKVQHPATGKARRNGPAARRRRRPADARKIMGGIRPYLFLAPFMISFFIFTIVPIGYAIWLSLFRVQLIGGRQFAGFSNYAAVFRQPAFWSGVLRVSVLGVVQVPVMLGLALFFALVFDTIVVGRAGAIYRVIYFVPYAVPGVISALMWGYLYDNQLSPFDAMMHGAHLGSPDFLSPSLLLPAIGNLETWQFVGYNMIVLYVALQAIPPEVRQAAIVDGASLRHIWLRINVPLVRTGLLLTTVMSIIGTLQMFTEPDVLMGFTPSVTSSYTPNLMIYSVAFNEQNLNYAAALSLVLGVITIVVIVGVLIVNNRRRGMRI